MKQTTPILLIILLLPGLFQGCWWKAIERENLTLRSQLDSLNRLYSSCVVENTRVNVRVDDLQRQNAKLEERNLEIANRMIEMGKLPPPPRVEPDDTPPLAEGVTFSQRTGVDPVAADTVTDAAVTPPTPDTPVPVQTPPQRPSTPAVQPTTTPPTSTAVTRPRTLPSPTTTTARAGERFLERYQAALAEFNLRHFAVALEGFTSLLSSFESNDMSDNCEYWIGECQYALGNYPAAIEHFTNVLRYTQSDKTDDALMMRGNTYMRVKDVTSARGDFQRIVDDFPESEFALRARQKLKSGR